MSPTYILTLLFTFLIFQLATAQIPKTMSYQGVLADADGNPVADGEVNLTFRLYDVAENGQFLWEEPQIVETENGLFNAILGSINPLGLVFDKPYWLGITVGQENEMTPRTALTASPYSLNTATEFAPGQGLNIRNENNEITHELSAEGDVTHSGVGAFLGGLVVGDSVLTVDTTDIGAPLNVIAKASKRRILNNIPFDTPDIAIAGKGSAIGVLGESNSGVGVRAVSTSGQGVFAITQSGEKAAVEGFGSGVGVEGISGGSGRRTGVIGRGATGVHGIGSIALHAEGLLQLDEVPLSSFPDKFLVWDTDNIVKYRSLPDGNGNLDCATCDDGVLKSQSVEISSGTSDISVFSLNRLSLLSKLASPPEATVEAELSLTADREAVLNLKLPDHSATTPAIKVAHGGAGSGVEINSTNPNFEGNFMRVGADQSIANSNMNGNGLSVNVNNTSMTALVASASTRAIAATNNTSNANSPTITATNFSPDGTGLSTNANAKIDGNLDVGGDISKGGGGFKIDHPLDPTNKYLSHSFVESPQRMNVYNGNAVLNANGEAVVKLPEYFGALNEDFRYQLTCIGGFAQVYIAEEIQENRFKIAGGASGQKVSWQVTGVRKDAFAKTNVFQVEAQKSPEEAGSYRHPEAFGQPKEMGTFYAKQPHLKKMMAEMKGKITAAKAN